MFATESLLSRTRELTRLLQSQAAGHVRFDDLAATLARLTEGDVLIVSRQGKVLASSAEAGVASGAILDEELNLFLLKLDEAGALNHLPLSGTHNEQKFSVNFSNLYAFPIYAAGTRQGTLLVNKSLDESGLVLAEYATTVLGMELLHSHQDEDQEANRKVANARMAINTLSYSETQAIVHLFKHLGGTEGLVVASKIADEISVTRSVFVNALRKLESAGVVTSRSLGMKGTYIKVLNEAFLDELAKVR